MRVLVLLAGIWAMAATAAIAETPIPGGLPPLPQPQGRAAEVEQLEREGEALKREARELGGGSSIPDSIRNVRNAFYEKKYEADRLEELAESMGYSRDELRAKQKEILNSEGFEAADFAGGQVKDKATEELLKRAVSGLLGKAFGLYSAADTVVDLVKRIERWRLRRETAGNLGDSARAIQANWTAMNQMLIALYGELAIDAARLRRLEEIRRRDAEIFERVASLRRAAVGGARLGRVGDPEYDKLVLDIDREQREIEQVRFRLRLAEMEGRRADAELLRQRLAELERRVEALERRADELEETPTGFGPVSHGCSAGIIYIPGTDTCLVVGGYAATSFLSQPSSLGVGTVRAHGHEGFAFSFDDSIQRWGGGLTLEYGLGESGSLFGFPAAPNYHFLFAEAEGAWGSARSQGSHAVGHRGVEAVAATLLWEDAAFGTGWVASAPGFGLTGEAEMSNSWAVGWLGTGHTFPLQSGEGTAAALVVKGGPYIEGIRFDSSGWADLTYDGSPYGGYRQAYGLDTRDLYLGVKVEAAHVWQPSPPWQFAVGASLSLGYHEGRGRIWQETDFGGSLVRQDEEYRRDSLFVGFGVGAGIKWRPTQNLSLESTVALDYVPDVTGYRMPQNPDRQPGAFSGRDVWRLNVRFLQIRAQF